MVLKGLLSLQRSWVRFYCTSCLFAPCYAFKSGVFSKHNICVCDASNRHAVVVISMSLLFARHGTTLLATRARLFTKANDLLMKHDYVLWSFSFLRHQSTLVFVTLRAPPFLCFCPIAPPPRISVCHTLDGTVLPKNVINGCNSAWKSPWVGASWLTQRRNSLLLSVELTKQGGVWVIVCVSVCVSACKSETERNTFLHMSVKCMSFHVRHVWAIMHEYVYPRVWSWA